VGEFYILLDDDQIMTTYGWNTKLASPLRKWSDLFSLSMRCAHKYPEITHLQGTKCTNTYAVHNRDQCIVHIRDSGNRGPLIIRASYAKQLGFLDEVNFMGFVTENDDHDFNHRAYLYHGWFSGQYSVDYTEERCCRSPSPSNDLLSKYRSWFHSRKSTHQLQIMETKNSYQEKNEDRQLC
jgi:hypothetical protein